MSSRRTWTAAVATGAAAALILVALVTYHFAAGTGTGTSAGNPVALGGPISPASPDNPAAVTLPTLSSTTVPLSTTAPASLPLPAGGSLSVPAGAVSGHGSLSARSVAAPAPPPTGAVFDGDIYDIQINNTQLTSNVTLTLPAPVITGPDVAIIAYYDTSAHAWTPVATSYQSATHLAVATSNRPSVWCVFRVDAAALTTWLDGTFTSFLTSGGTVAQPVCVGSAQVAALGLGVVSSAGSLVKSCVGESGGHYVLTVANDRGFAIALDYPQAWSPQAGTWSDVDTAVIDGLSGLRTGAPVGDSVAIIPGGEAMTFAIPAGAAGVAQLVSSPAAYLTSAFIYGVNVLGQTADRTPFVSAPRSGADLAAVRAALRDQSCLASAQSVLDVAVTDASSAASVFWQGLNLAGSCLGKEWAGANGDTGFGASYVDGVYSWLVGGLQPYGRSLGAWLDSDLYWQGDTVGVGAPTAPATPASPTAPTPTTTPTTSATATGTASSPTTPAAPTTPATIAPTTSAVPTLGIPMESDEQGFGQVKPSRIYLGGDPLGLVVNITWSSWGGSMATGTGTSDWVTSGESVAQGSQEQVTVVAFNLGTCNGTAAYESVEWYFPQYGQSFNPGQPWPACPSGSTGH